MDYIAAYALRDNYDTNVDSLVIASILAGTGVGSVTDNTAATITLFLADLAAAKESVFNTLGNRRPATHAFVSANVLQWVEKQVGSSGLPLVSPAWTKQPFAGLAASGDPNVAAWTGHEIEGLAVFQDLNIPNSGSNDQFLVGRPRDIQLAEGPLQVKAYPETYASELQVVIEVFA